MAITLPEKTGPWTVDDLADLPEGPWRYEIVDGSLLMSPAPAPRHELVLARLWLALREQVPSPDRVLGPAGVTFDSSYRVPDLVVVKEGVDLWEAKLISPADVELAIEIMSPGSVTEDRITKPAQYAALGIGAFWRVETDDEFSLTAYSLPSGGDVYAQVGVWREGEQVDLHEPFDIHFAVDHLRN